MRTRKTIVTVLSLVVGLAAREAGAGMTTRMSVTHAGGQANGTATSSAARAVSADARYVAFHSNATNLVVGDTNALADIFVRDRVAGTTVRVNLTTAGTQGNGSSFNPAISGDGRFVAFESGASNLVPGDTNGATDVFLRDRDLGTTTRVSVASDGAQGNGTSQGAAISADGRLVVFRSAATNLAPGDTNGVGDVFIHDRQSGTTTRASVASDGSQANGASTNPVVSADGAVVGFESGATNLVAGDSNAVADVFVHEPATGTTARVSVGLAGVEGAGASVTPALSADGRFVAFRSAAPNLVPGDTNSQGDVFVHDRLSGATTRVSVASDGTQANSSGATPALSADGGVVAFQSSATNLVPGDSNGQADVFVHERATATTMRASVGPGGVQANGVSSAPSLSDDGLFVAFTSTASNLVAEDTTSGAEVFGEGPVCGDGLPDAGEACDDGNLIEGDGCDSNCTASACGNAVVAPGEGCDDGNLADGDGCDANCTPTGCGNGVVTAGEECDDGNLVDGDGCNADCTLVACGDGVLEPGLEQCDDGNLADGDGCDSNCTPTACGNGILTTGEVCDDANLVDGDGCDSNCTPTGCGNGVVTAGEACDDGNAVDGDGCDGNCTPSACGNGIVAAPETCDDGNQADGDGCDANCTPTGCGNGVVSAGEACDDGNGEDGDGCDAGCVPSLCVGGATMRGASFTIERLGGQMGDERLVFRGRFAFAPGTRTDWRAAARGVQVWIGDLGVPDGTLIDMTHLTAPVPPAGAERVCRSRRNGWRAQVGGRVHIYRSRGGTDDSSSCRGGPDRGVVVVKLADRSARRGEVEFMVMVKDAFAVPVGPVRGIIVLGATAADGLRGACAAHTFTACTSYGTTFVCG